MSCSFVPDFGLKSCCDKHDEAYRKGGTEAYRFKADYSFFLCMRKKGSKFVSFAYFFGVRLFGWLFFCYGGKKSLFERFAFR